MWSLPFATVQGTHVTDEIITQGQVPVLFEIYGAGVVATFGILTAMYTHAYRLRDALDLTAAETLDARVQIYRNVGIAAIGALSILIAVISATAAPRLVSWAGLVYFAIGIVEWILGEYHGRMRRKLASTPHPRS
jgi:hypothetical protein